ncbi:MAG: hypothetical protein V9G18_21965 [Albidovulum sp.]|jgi:hypothetical protein|uniref:hypothetical protein n=1 Tax=Tabrizicola sp. TaxID=2005166 RepID=UPI00302E7985
MADRDQDYDDQNDRYARASRDDRMRNRGWQGEERSGSQARTSGRAWSDAGDFAREDRGREDDDFHRSGWNQDMRDPGRARGGAQTYAGGSRHGGQTGDDAYSGAYPGFRDESAERRFGERGPGGNRAGQYGTGQYGAGQYGAGQYGAGHDWREADPSRPGSQGYRSGSGWVEDDNRALAERHGDRPEPGRHRHEQNFRVWRDRQTQQFDDDFAAFSDEKQKQFDTEFDEWRKNRAQKGGAATGMVGGHTTGQTTGQAAGDAASEAARNREGGAKKP